MSLVKRTSSLMRNLFHRDRVERDLDAEIEAYLEALTREKVEAGMTPDEARRAARIELGGAEQIKEEVRAIRAGVLVEQLGQDLRFGLRMLIRNRGFALLAVLTLALGIGANTAVFSIVHAVLLHPLPYPRPDRLVTLRQAHPQRGLDYWRLSQANFAAYGEQVHGFEMLAAFTWTGYNMRRGGESTRVQAANVSAEFFDVLGIPPLAGRTFLPGEDAAGRRQPCVLGYGLWQRRFGGDPGVVGESIALDNVPTGIIGVMPRGFRFIDPTVEMWVTLDLSPERPSPFNLLGLARLKPGVRPAETQAEATHVLRSRGSVDAAFIGRVAVAGPDADMHAVVLPLQEAMSHRSRTALLLLLGSSGLVLLMTCANVANLLLARATTRSREIAVRFALGATAARVVRQLMTECLLIGALGGAAGLVLAASGLRLVTGLPLAGIWRIDEADLNVPVLIFTVAAGLASTRLFGLLPVLRMNRLGARNGLHAGARSTAAPVSRRTNGALVALQFALSVVLLVGTGLLLKSFQRVLAVDPGFDASKVLTLSLYYPPRKEADYANPFAPASGDEGEASARFFTNLAERVRALPGVRAAGFISSLPLTGEIDADGTILEGHEPQDGAEIPVIRIARAGPGYFRAMQIPLPRGRDFADGDGPDSMPVAIVDEVLARRYWPDADAVGRRVRYSWDTSDNPWRTIVGVVSGIRDAALAEDRQAHVYYPITQERMRRLNLVVRTEGDPDAAVGSVRAALRAVDPSIPAFDVRTMDATVGESLFQQKFTNALLGLFAVLSLLLAATGIYGVLSLEVASRLKELAIRVALGARPVEVFGLVIRHGVRLAAAGLLPGVAGAFALTRVLENMLFEVEPTDPATFATAIVLLTAVAMLACVIPARRATRVDPILWLRQE
ncbi:MAG: ADOP family duplicated permease [Candidatus Polarisedimenticolia bacterium]